MNSSHSTLSEPGPASASANSIFKQSTNPKVTVRVTTASWFNEEDELTQLTGDATTERFAPLRSSAPRVLLAAQTRDQAELAQTLLTYMGARVTMVGDGLLAEIEALKHHAIGTPYDLVVLETTLLKRNGVEVAQRLRRIAYHGTLYALVGAGGARAREEFAKEGFDGCLSMPINVGELRAALKPRD